MPPLVYLQRTWLGKVLFELKGRTLRITALRRGPDEEVSYDLSVVRSDYQRFSRRTTEPLVPLGLLATFLGWLSYRLATADFIWGTVLAVYPAELMVFIFVPMVKCLQKTDFVRFSLRGNNQIVQIVRNSRSEPDFERFVTELEARSRLIEEGTDVGDWADADNEEGVPRISAARYDLQGEEAFPRDPNSAYWLIAMLGGGAATGLALTSWRMPEAAGEAFMLSFIGTMVGIVFGVVSLRYGERLRGFGILGLILALLPFGIFFATGSPP